MKTEKIAVTKRPGLLVAMVLPTNNGNSSENQDEIPYSSQKTEESSGVSPDRDNLPPTPQQTIVERDDNELPEEYDIPLEEDPFTEPAPDLDEIDPDQEENIDVDFPSKNNPDRIDRDPIVQPGTDPMKTDNSQII